MSRQVVMALVLLAACAAAPDGSAEPSARFTARPVLVQASEELSDACVGSLAGLVGFFRDHGMATIAITTVDAGSASVSGIPVRGVVGIYPGVPQLPGSLAETKRSFTIGGDIFAAEIVLRATDPRSCDPRALGHEMGHALGLVDTGIPGNLMNGTLELSDWSLTESQLEWIAD